MASPSRSHDEEALLTDDADLHGSPVEHAAQASSASSYDDVALDAADDDGHADAAPSGFSARALAFLSRAWTYITGVIKAQWFIFMMGVVILIAWWYPPLGARGGPLKPEYTISYGSVALIFLVSGISMRTSAIRSALLAFKLQLLSQLMIFGVIPAIGYGLAMLISTSDGVSPDIVLGFVVLACLPTTISSCSILTKLGGGNEAASVTISVIANVIGVFLSPALLLLFLGESSGMDFGSVLLKLGITVVVPMAIGQAILYFFPAFVAKIKEKVPLSNVNQCMLLLFLYTIFCDTFSAQLNLVRKRKV